jgi:putative ABC transport system permease protein
MIANYFKTAFRNLIRNKNYTIINIAGLAAGIAVCLIIFIIIQFETSFDNFHQKKSRTYRVLTEYHHADAASIFYGRGVPLPMPATLKSSFPQIEKVAVTYSEGNDQVLVLDDNGHPVKKFKEEKGVIFTEPAFFDILDFKWLAGGPATLKDPNSVALTRITADKYFGDWKTAIGKTIKWNNSQVLKVTGILADIPANTDFQVKVVIAFGTGYTADIAKSTNWDGTGTSFNCYVLLSPNANEVSVNTQLRALAKKMKSADNKDSHILQSLSKVHYATDIGNYSGKSISPELIRVLWLIAAFILLIACVNFINLATAQAVNRSKEVGVRKVLGSNKWQLKMQFFAETFLIVITAMAVAIIITIIALPFISAILDLQLSFHAFYNPLIYMFLSVLIIAVTALAAFYPSLVLSRFNPVNALKNRLAAKSTKGISLRRGLVVFQFIIAQVLIIATLIIIKQMNFFTNQSLGFTKEAVLNVPFPSDSAGISKLDYVKKELTAINGIQHVSFSSNTPVEDNNDNWNTFNYDHSPKETDFYAITKWSDHEYVPTYELSLIAGKNLDRSDTANGFLVNESLIEKLGISNPADALNKEISMWDGQLKANIVGVLKDFHDRSFRAPFAPLIVACFKKGYSQAGIKLATKDASTALKGIENTWSKSFPDFVFEYQFLDEKINSFYKDELRLSQLYKIFAVIAIFLSCLGLYGLASFMAVQRIKEVGIRKVLGASVSSVVYLFSKEFIILILIAFVIASPVAWYFMDKWLQDYVYRINISWWIFIIGGLAAIIIALVTVSFQAIKAAIANPVKSLRTE